MIERPAWTGEPVVAGVRPARQRRCREDTSLLEEIPQHRQHSRSEASSRRIWRAGRRSLEIKPLVINPVRPTVYLFLRQHKFWLAAGPWISAFSVT